MERIHFTPLTLLPGFWFSLRFSLRSLRLCVEEEASFVPASPRGSFQLRLDASAD
jgi:hypothetical protein